MRYRTKAGGCPRDGLRLKSAKKQRASCDQSFVATACGDFAALAELLDSRNMYATALTAASYPANVLTLAFLLVVAKSSIESLCDFSPAPTKLCDTTLKSILDPSFRYIPSFNTDLQKTFARIRRDHRKDAETAAQATPDALSNVSSIVRKTATSPR